MFGIGDRQDAVQLVGEAVTLEGYLGVTIFREVAEAEFLGPSGPGGPVLLRLIVAEGTHAAWLPPVGAPELAYQGELSSALAGLSSLRPSLPTATCS